MIEHVGTGGTADVFRARDKKTNQLLALKVLKPEATRHVPTRKAFVAEGKLLARLDHPALLRGHGVARSGNTFFSRLAYVDGRTVLEELDAGRRFTEEEALAIVLDVARALEYLEGQGVVHRDVKPGNVMLRKDGGAVLIDLGFAASPGEHDGQCRGERRGHRRLPLAGAGARRGQTPTCRSDIYSAWASPSSIMVVGRLPFESSDDREVLRMQIMDSLSSPELKSARRVPAPALLHREDGGQGRRRALPALVRADRGREGPARRERKPGFREGAPRSVVQTGRPPAPSVRRPP